VSVDVRDWNARRRLADAHAALAVAQAHGLDPARPDLEQLHPLEFAQAVHTWSLAHPVQPDPLLAQGHDVRSGSGAHAYALSRARQGAVLCAGCEEWVLKEDLAVDPEDPDWLLIRCRRCVARGAVAAGA
jgi:hypothetical protein